jgi:hypothetical protein
VVVSGHGGDCDFRFEHGKGYLVFASSIRDDPAILYTSKCTRTKDVTNAALDLAALGSATVQAMPVTGLREGWFRRTLRRGWTSVLIGYAGTESYFLHQKPVTRVISASLLMLIIALLAFPLARLARKHPRRLAIAIVAVFALSGMIVVGMAYNELRGNPWLSHYLY